MKLKSLRVVVLRGLRSSFDVDTSPTNNGAGKSAKTKEGGSDGEIPEHDISHREERDDERSPGKGEN
jgi:hypothetical protein